MDEIVQLVMNSYDKKLIEQFQEIQKLDQSIRANIPDDASRGKQKELLAEQREIDIANLEQIEEVIAEHGYVRRQTPVYEPFQTTAIAHAFQNCRLVVHRWRKANVIDFLKLTFQEIRGNNFSTCQLEGRRNNLPDEHQDRENDSRFWSPSGQYRLAWSNTLEIVKVVSDEKERQ